MNLNGTGVTGSRIVHVKKNGTQKGDITITGNLTMSQSYSSVANAPQIILIADGDITINAGVTRVDAWLIAKGQINTCEDEPANANDCRNSLLLTGPIAASRLNLYRTYGADLTTADAAKPAEQFLLNPIHLLRRYGPTNTGPNPNGQPISEKDLPPWY